MCLMCIEIAKGRMTLAEARRALPEMVVDNKSPEEVRHFEEMQRATDEELMKNARTHITTAQQR